MLPCTHWCFALRQFAADARERSAVVAIRFAIGGLAAEQDRVITARVVTALLGQLRKCDGKERHRRRRFNDWWRQWRNLAAAQLLFRRRMLARRAVHVAMRRQVEPVGL